jgi:hypothetical protein
MRLFRRIRKEGYVNCYYRGIPGYFNKESEEIEGRNIIFCILIEINLFVDTYILKMNFFPLILEKEINKKN